MSKQHTLARFFSSSKSDSKDPISKSLPKLSQKRERSRSSSPKRASQIIEPNSTQETDVSDDIVEVSPKKAKIPISDVKTGKRKIAKPIVVDEVEGSEESTGSESEAKSETSDDEDIKKTPIEEEITKEEAVKDAKLEKIADKIDKDIKEQKESLPQDAKVPIQYKQLTDIFDVIEETSSRLEMIAIVSKFFLTILETNPDKLTRIVYLFINRLGPDYEPDLELGLGETLLMKTISECYGRTLSKVREDFHEQGDLGQVALQSRVNQPTMFKPKPLDVDFVFENLHKIAKLTGSSSQSRKISIIIKMLTACNGTEAKFLIRSLEGKLRIGLAEKTILISLAKAFLLFEKIHIRQLNEVEEMIREAFCQVPNYEVIINTAIKYGILNLQDHCKLKPGIPLKPMLAKPTKSISEILDRFKDEEFTCEYKYDGERAQVHLISDGSIKIYSRNSEDMSQRYPDIIQNVKNFTEVNSNVKSIILDCEAVAWDRETQKILPFQVLSTRKRKDVEESQIKVHICLFVFDILCLNDEPLINKSLKERRDVMHEVLTPIPGKLQFATAMNSSNIDDLQAFLDISIKHACEGLMVKSLYNESQYEPSKRSRNWLKLKKDYLDGMGDSLDLVVIGAYIGKGKRTGGYGGFLLASYNQDTGEYETTCKIGTGFSEEMLKTLYEKLRPTESSEPKSYYIYDTNNSNAVPDVWFEPTTLFEVLTADLSLSPIYKAGISSLGRGISLRFPRFIRIRDDKGVEDGTSSEQMIEFYERQANLN